tara:strand:- start:10519 stop:12267 length:1749 start_codon:yes stop_codon:yes gene_type:complete
MALKSNVCKQVYLLLGAMLLGVLLNIFLVRYIKYSVFSDFQGIAFYLPGNSVFKSTLYYSFSNEFSQKNKVFPETGINNELYFKFPKTDIVPTNFRLDFGNDSSASLVSIDSMGIIYSDKSVVINQKELFSHIIMNSAAINLNKYERKLSFNSLASPFDPYIVFDPLLKILSDNHPLKWGVYLAPFLIFIVFNLNRWRVTLKLDIVDILFMLFIVCIPLKIAWTTFVTILICAYGIFLVIKEKKFDFKNNDALLLLGFFLVLLIFGRPSSLKVIDHQLAFILFFFIISTIKLNWNRISKFYVYFMLLLNAIIVSSGIGFLFSFHEIFGLAVSEYFLEIKTYSGNIREWLYYDHAVFLTFFGLIGVVLLKNIVDLNRENRGVVMAYHVLLVATILLVGARISLLIYGVFIINLILKFKPKLRLASNTIVFLSILLLLFKFIGSVDQNRLGLWSVTWQAIKEKPLLGYGLGSSNQILHQEYFMKKANTVIPEILNHSHNQFLTVLLEIGFVGTSLLMILIVVYLKRTGQYKSMPMVLFIFGLCYVFLTESILQTSKPLFVLCFLFAMITKIPKSVIPNELDSQA